MRYTQGFLILLLFSLIQTNLFSQTDGNNEFNFDCFQRISQSNTDENIFYSPLSISTSFAVPYAGSEGLTKTQIEKVFRFDDNTKRNLKNYYKLTNRLERANDVNFRVANSLWIDKTMTFDRSFLRTTKNLTGKDNIYEAAFTNDAETERNKINSWVSNNTNGTIRSLLSPNSLNAFTKFVMANAIYFKGNWEIPFDKELTATNEFYGLNGQTIPTQFMTKKVEKHRYFENDEVQVLELGYEGRDISMIMVLPRFADNFQKIQQSLNATKFNNWMESISPRPVVVTIPKFQMNIKYDMRSILRKMDLKEPFTENANFSEISKKPLRISKVIHQAYLQIDEMGTEASAATAIVGVPKGALNQKPAFFNANQPFLFFIIDKSTNTILFTGRLTQPNYKDAQEYSDKQPKRFPVIPIPQVDEVHWVKKGETLYAVSRQYNVPVEQIISLNNLTTNSLQVNQKLLIKEGEKTTKNALTAVKPTKIVNQTKSPTVSPIKTEIVHKVAKGESLFAISRKYKIGIEEIKDLNNLNSNVLSINQELIVSKGIKLTKTQSDIKTVTTQNIKKHTVKKGETLWKIANSYALSVDKIKALNNMKSNVISIGQQLIIGN